MKNRLRNFLTAAAFGRHTLKMLNEESGRALSSSAPSK